jgi:uncharacterized protein
MLPAHLLVSELELAPHPEGGFYRELYRATEGVARDALPGRFPADRSFSTAIYFLVPHGTFSALHTIKSDECWHHYDGGALRIVTIDPGGERRDLVLGKDYARGERPFHVVPHGRVFGTYPEGDAPYALVGCTVSPGFDFADFVMDDRASLLARFPQHAEIIAKLTR